MVRSRGYPVDAGRNVPHVPIDGTGSTRADTPSIAMPGGTASCNGCATLHKKIGRIIKLITLQEILDEQHVQKM